MSAVKMRTEDDFVVLGKHTDTVSALRIFALI